MKGKIKKYGSTIFLILILSFSIWYYKCLPKQLFDAPVSLILIDKNQELLSAHVAKDEQWRFPQADSVNPKFCKAIVAFEDKRFYNHLGVDLLAICRAIKLNFQQNRVVSGGSTLSMQVVRLSRNNPHRTYGEKILELFRATRLEIQYSKTEILNMYASHAPFGGNVVGIDAASWKYFGKNQHKLSWSETAMLAVLPNAPSLIHPGKNRDLLLVKRNRLLNLLFEKNQIDSLTCYLSKLEPLPSKPVNIPNYASHLMNDFLKKGKTGYVQTTVDIHLQNKVSKILEKQALKLKAKAVHNASVIVVDVHTGGVLSYIGNIKDKYKKYENDVDMIRSKRSTGSILKPLLYAEMLDDGKILPHTLIQDIPVDFYGYVPKNYDLSYDGVVPASQVISRSLNIPSVNMLKDYGVNRFLSKLKNYGFSSIDKSGNHYGLSLILGGAEVTPWDLAKVYTGMVQKLKGEQQIITLETSKNKRTTIEYPEKSAIWYMMEAMLNVTRPGEDRAWKTFGNSNKIAWKTGTSFGGRDAWAVGCTPDYVVVVWTGNTDGEGRPKLSGFGTSAPILFDVFNTLGNSKKWFDDPTYCHVKVCFHSGMKANKHCEFTKNQKIPSRGKSSKCCVYCKNYGLDSTRSFDVGGSDYPLLDRINKSFFVLKPREAYYYKKKHVGYVQGPSSILKSGKFDVLYPKNNSKVYLPKLSDKIRSSMVVKMTAEDQQETLYWTLDNKYLGITKRKHELVIDPGIGKHQLTVINKLGKRVNVNFEVVE